LEKPLRVIADLAGTEDPILWQIALLELASVVGQIEPLAEGTVVFSLTESWRMVYEQILRSHDVRKYRSVAWVKMADYWQDPPGRQSMQVNRFATRWLHRMTVLHSLLAPRASKETKKFQIVASGWETADSVLNRAASLADRPLRLTLCSARCGAGQPRPRAGRGVRLRPGVGS
jgi:hypothetical protein